MRTLRQLSSLLAAAGTLLLVWCAPALADGYLTFGTGDWWQSEPEAKFQEFHEVPRGVFVESFLYRDDFWNGRVALWGRNVIRSDQLYGLTYRRPRWTADVSYAETPHNFSFIAATGYALVDPATQILPDLLQRANQGVSNTTYTANMRDYLSTAKEFHLGFGTDIMSARLRGRPGQGFRFELTGSRKNRAGNKAYGGPFATPGSGVVVETIEPIRQSMADGQGKLSYTRNRVTVEAMGGYSAFENDHSTLRWDNPKAFTDSIGRPTYGQLDLYPDNQQWRTGASIGIQLPQRTSFTGTFQWARTTQDNDWLPYTVNTALLDSTNANPLPGANTDGKADLLTLDARLTTHPHRYVGGTARVNHFKYDNKTPEHTLGGQAIADLTWSAGSVESHPFGNERTTYGIDVDVNPAKAVGLFGTYEHIVRKRTFREVTEDAEDAVVGKVVLKPRPWLQASARYRHGDRELDEFHLDDYLEGSTLIEQPDLRRYDIANRVQDLIDASISWTGTERATVSATFRYLENAYEDTGLGLQQELTRSAAIDATVNATDRLELSGAFGWARMYSSQESRRSPSGAVQVADSLGWRARLYDEIVYGSGGVTYQAVPDRLTLGVTGYYERAPGTYRLTGEGAYPNPAADLPGTVYLRQGAGAEATYNLEENTDLSLRWGWEQFNVSDFAVDDVPLFMISGNASSVFLGDSIQDYRAHQVALILRRSF